MLKPVIWLFGVQKLLAAGSSVAWVSQMAAVLVACFIPAEEAHCFNSGFYHVKKYGERTGSTCVAVDVQSAKAFGRQLSNSFGRLDEAGNFNIAFAVRSAE